MTLETKAEALEIWKAWKAGDGDFTALQCRTHNCGKNKDVAGQKSLDSVSQNLREHELKLKKGCAQWELPENSVKDRESRKEETLPDK